MAGRVRNLLQREGRFFARVVVPVELRSILGKSEFRAAPGADLPVASDLPFGDPHVTAIYMEDATYARLVAAIVEAVTTPDPVTGGLDPDAIKIALGEAGDVWPASIAARAVTGYIHG